MFISGLCTVQDVDQYVLTPLMQANENEFPDMEQMAEQVLLSLASRILLRLPTVSAEATMLYPLMAAARYVSLANFFENSESLVMAIWIIGAFVKISVFFYVIVLGSAQLMDVTDYRPLVWPIGFLIVLFSFWGIPNMIVFNYLDETSLPYYGFFMQILLPLLLLLIAKLRNKPQRMKSAA